MNRTKRKTKRFVNKRINKAIKIEKVKNNRKSELFSFLKRLKVKVIENPEKKALDAYKAKSKDGFAKVHPTNHFLINITMNYIRHYHTNYDIIIKEIKLLNVDEKYLFKKKVNELIYKKYKGFVYD